MKPQTILALCPNDRHRNVVKTNKFGKAITCRICENKFTIDSETCDDIINWEDLSIRDIDNKHFKRTHRVMFKAYAPSIYFMYKVKGFWGSESVTVDLNYDVNEDGTYSVTQRIGNSSGGHEVDYCPIIRTKNFSKALLDAAKVLEKYNKVFPPKRLK